MWGGGLWSDPLERPPGPRGRRGPTAPGTLPRESALSGPGHSAISRAASILVLFKLTHYPRVGCDSRAGPHATSGRRALQRLAQSRVASRQASWFGPDASVGPTQGYD